MITTIITTYRRPELLKRAVESVLAQTYSDLKLCVYDDASNDETQEVMEEFVRMDSRIRYHRHKVNIGIMANYAYAFAEINTPYFSFFSDDDYLLPNFYSTALDGFKHYPDTIFSACAVEAMTASGRIVSNPLSLWSREGYFPAPEGVLEMTRLRGCFLLPTGILFRSDLAKEIQPDLSPEVTLMWDSDYFMQMAARYPIVVSFKKSAVFLVHDGGYSSGFYSELEKSAAGFEKHIVATQFLLQRIVAIASLPEYIKNKIIVDFENALREDFFTFMYYYLINLRPEETNQLMKLYSNHYTPDNRVLILSFLAKQSIRFPLLGKPITYLMRITSKIIKCLRKLRNIIQKTAVA